MLDVEELKRLFRYDAESGEIYWIVKRSGAKPGLPAGTAHNAGYVSIRVNGKAILAHRLAWILHYGHLPQGEIDHVNGDRKDNRIENLRLASRSQQQCNQKIRADNQTGVRGVSFDNSQGKWVGRVQGNGGKIHVGTFDSKEEAIQKTNQARRDLHQEFTRASA